MSLWLWLLLEGGVVTEAAHSGGNVSVLFAHSTPIAGNVFNEHNRASESDYLFPHYQLHADFDLNLIIL